MPMLLFRSLLRDVLTKLAGLAFSAREPTREPTIRYLIVVARNQPALYEHLRNRHGRDPGVQVVVDRRGDGNVETTADPPPVERRRRQSWLAAGASHELVELPAEDTAGSRSPKQEPSVRHEEASRQMSETQTSETPMSVMGTLEDPQRVARWLAESQQMVDRVIPALIGERDRLRQSLEAREQEDVAAGGHHEAPRGRRRLHAEPEERQRRLDEDSVRHEERRVDAERREHVRQDVPQDECRAACPEGARCPDVLRLLERQDRGADHARDRRRAPDADGDRRVDDAGAERGDDRDRQQKVREGEQDLDPPHDRRVEPPTGEARDAAERAAGHDRDGGRERPDEERHTRAVDHPREDVAAELVRAEEVLGVRARALLEERLLDGILRREERCRRRDQDEPGDERQAEERQAVSPEPPGRVGAHPCLEMRGSRRPYERSTSRFTRTIESPKSEPSRASASKLELGLTAETTPAGTPTSAVIRSAATVSSSVAGHVSASSSTTGRFWMIERPRSPRASCPTYCA